MASTIVCATGTNSSKPGQRLVRGALECGDLGGVHGLAADIDAHAPRPIARRPPTRRRPRSALAAARRPASHPVTVAGFGRRAALTRPNRCRANSATRRSRARRAGTADDDGCTCRRCFVGRRLQHGADLVAETEQERAPPLLGGGAGRPPLTGHAARRLRVERVVEQLGRVEVAAEPGDERHGAPVCAPRTRRDSRVPRR